MEFKLIIFTPPRIVRDYAGREREIIERKKKVYSMGVWGVGVGVGEGEFEQT